MYAILSYVIVLGHSPVGLVSLAAIVALVVFFTTWKFIGKMYEWEEELGDGIDKRKRSDVADHLCTRDHCQGDGEL
jgi:hypothetical protein